MIWVIKHARTGDEAEADSVESALLAADTLAHDCSEATGRPLVASRGDIVITDGHGWYAGGITEAARRGARSL
jgi:hypothetical protein